MSEITPAQKTALLKLEGFKEIQKQYAKESKMVGSGKRRMKGGGFWDDVGNWFRSVGTSVNDFLKRTKIISNVAGAVLPLLAPLGTALLTANPIAAAASVGAAKAATEGIKSLGYGSKSMKGKGLTRQSNGLIVNQRGGAIDPGLLALGKFAFNALGVPIVGTSAIQKGLSIIEKSRMKGGDARLSIVPPEMRLQGRGLTRQYNGLIVNQKGGRRMIGRGAGTEYGTVSSAFGEIAM